MTGRLTISFLWRSSDHRRGSGLLAKVVMLATSEEEEILGPTSFVLRTSEPQHLHLPAGRFRVVVTLPSGQLVQKQAVVNSGATTLVTLAGPTSNRDVPSFVIDSGFLAATRERGSRTVDVARDLDWLSGLIDHSDPGAPAETWHLNSMELQAAHVDEGSVRRERASDATVVVPQDQDADAAWRGLASGRLPFPDDPVDGVVTNGSQLVRADETRPTLADVNRLWFTATSDEGTRMAGVLPAFSAGYERLHAGLPDAAPESGMADDPVFTGLYDYFQSGRMVAAWEFLKVVRGDVEMSARLAGDALSSCMAGYVDLAVGRATVDGTDAGRWRIVDACVIKAKALLMSEKVDAGTLDEALAEAKRAYRAGVPFFGVGLSHLLEVLETAGEEDAEAAEMAGTVARVADRVDQDQPFTLLRYAAQTPAPGSARETPPSFG